MLGSGTGEGPVARNGTRTEGLEIGFCCHLRERDHGDAEWVNSRLADGALNEAEVVLTRVQYQGLGIGNSSFYEG
jgi:hypothetical protein